MRRSPSLEETAAPLRRQRTAPADRAERSKSRTETEAVNDKDLEAELKKVQSEEETSPESLVHEALEQTNQLEGPTEGSVLVGWALVAEWVDLNGDRTLVKLANQDATDWQIDGYLYAGLHSNFEEDDE